jgi:hypothetical protein
MGQSVQVELLRGQIYVYLTQFPHVAAIYSPIVMVKTSE